MYKVITNEDEIKKCQESFQATLSTHDLETIKCFASFRGGKVEIEALWSERLKMWVAFRISRLNTPKYWTAFGFEKPKPKSNLSITAEINFSFTGSGNIQGVFIRDNMGDVYVGHRGRFGDKRRILSDAFFDRVKHKFQIVTLSNRNYRAVLIGKLKGQDLPEQIQCLFQEVSRMKEENANEIIADV